MARVKVKFMRKHQLHVQAANHEIEAIRAKLIEAQSNGFTDQSLAEILKDIKRD